MESFTLLKYWRPSDGADTTSHPRATRNNTIAIPAASDEPYFDLEFTPPTDDDEDTGEVARESPEIDEKSSVNTETESGRSSAADESPDQETDNDDDDEKEEEEEEEEEEELKFDVKSGENNVIISPSSIIAEDHNSKLPASLLKSATKFRVLLLKLKKTKSSNKSGEKTGSSNLFVEFDVDEVKGPLISLFARDNTTKAKTTLLQDSDSKCDERNLTKEMVVHKYLKMFKPIRVPGRHVEKMKFSVTGGSSSSTAAAAGVSPPELRRSNVVKVKKSTTTHQNQGGNTSNTRRKHLGKSRSSSAMVVGGMGSNRRRDDSLLQQEDGIRGAILHCKRSFNGTRDGESAVLSRSVSDPSYNI